MYSEIADDQHGELHLLMNAVNKIFKIVYNLNTNPL